MFVRNILYIYPILKVLPNIMSGNQRKLYISPEVEIIETEEQDIICESSQNEQTTENELF